MMRRITAVAVLLIAAAACPVCTSESEDAHSINRGCLPHSVYKTVSSFPGRFHTRRGKNVCADPDQEWVRRAMRRVDEDLSTFSNIHEHSSLGVKN
uniref:Chemokine interleukin-8-like domain-containing protein n=1 Tax=Paramormyrops kingsleyae TaxID=1676925 RepID=A0A3B3Q5J6_9TELE